MSETTSEEKHFCLVCSQEMRAHHEIVWSDYVCSQSEHHFSYRVVDHRMVKLRVRFGAGEHKLHLKVHYTQDFSEVWSRSKSTHRIRINHIIVPDFSDVEKLKNKIKTCLVFG